eukprot:8950544-Lingulodinium_polyedra.AAC.1
MSSCGVDATVAIELSRVRPCHWFPLRPISGACWPDDGAVLCPRYGRDQSLTGTCPCQRS